MAITHRYIGELELMEQQQIFCDANINNKSKILVIGTFNPNNDSCSKENNALWFYGRNQSNFWRYFPKAISGKSLHPLDTHLELPQTWKKFCVDNQIVIIDLIKTINNNEILQNFGDREVEDKINPDLTNIDYFKVEKAFRNISFERVIYSLKWSDKKIQKLRLIRDMVNNALLDNGCIQNLHQIKYCLTPSRNDAFDSWDGAINGNLNNPF